MSFLPGMTGAVSLVGGVSLIFRGAAEITSTTSNPTYSGFSIGSAAADRLVIVAVHCDNAASVNSATIGGVSASVARDNNAPGSASSVALIYAVVPSGTTATIDISLSSSIARNAIAVWTVTGLSSSTPTATNEADGDGSSAAASVTPSAGGIVIAALSLDNANSVTWSNVTEAYDVDLDSGGMRYSGASLTNVSGSSVSASASYSSGGGEALVVAAWR